MQLKLRSLIGNAPSNNSFKMLRFDKVTLAATILGQAGFLHNNSIAMKLDGRNAVEQARFVAGLFGVAAQA